MGQVYSHPMPPPGASIIEIEAADCTCEPLNGRKWDATKPPAAAAWSDAQWREYSDEMYSLIQSYKKDGIAHFALLLIPLGVIVLLAGLGQPRDGFSIMHIIHVPFIFLAVIIFFTISSTLKQANMEVDRKIDALCRSRSGAGVTLQYAQMFTGVCKPKGAKTYRAVYVIPGDGGGFGGQPMGGVMPMAAAPMPQGQMMQVTCPVGSKAGDTIQVATAQGPMQLVVPAGVTEGMVFQMQIQAPVVAQAVPVQAQPVMEATVVGVP